eukprot:gb/GECG01002219.1/.p1 GENE.gb/GECG01002219.1/~~gb/GECG01002219.1/.p1  ORF type:complete len:138 (+),score=19.56 gb/GECG01002219.1/:1-414(+)
MRPEQYNFIVDTPKNIYPIAMLLVIPQRKSTPLFLAVPWGKDRVVYSTDYPILLVQQEYEELDEQVSSGKSVVVQGNSNALDEITQHNGNPQWSEDVWIVETSHSLPSLRCQQGASSLDKTTKESKRKHLPRRRRCD